MTDEQPTPLETEIRRRIAGDGPMPVAEFMALCLYDPDHGYYSRRMPFGAAGDFVTAPEVSQMFGELVGLWAVTAWRAMGEPNPVQLIEMGPGRGTMMFDMLLAARTVPEFRKALRVHLIEKSLDLQMRQRQTLAGVTDVVLRWHGTMEEVPSGHAIIVANEFFDALPIRQAERCSDGWHERAIGINAGDQLALTALDKPIAGFEADLPRSVRKAPVGSIFEWRSGEFIDKIARRAASDGAALIIDYGHAASSVGDTFQAVRSHRYASPMALPGLTDLTAHVDFEALARAARKVGARVHGPVDQGTFLKRLGIETRAATLQARAAEEKRSSVAVALARLIGTGSSEMGALFKAIAFSAQRIDALPGFVA